MKINTILFLIGKTLVGVNADNENEAGDCDGVHHHYHKPV